MINIRDPLILYSGCAIFLCVLPMSFMDQLAWVGPALSVLILVFGLPHGAYDIFLVRAQFSPSRSRKVVGLYLLTALGVASIWWAAK